MLKTFARYWCGWAVRLFPGSPFRRLRIFIWRMAGFNVHPSANILPTVRMIYGDIHIGKNTFVGAEAMITGGKIFIGNNCDIAPRVIIHAGNHKIGSSDRRAGVSYAGNIKINDGSWIASGAIILDGTILGKGCIVAAGSVVVGEFPDNVLIAGVPAKIKKWLSNSEKDALEKTADVE